jgi:peptidoglycan/LPS O-acetylase OafA/YrhL
LEQRKENCFDFLRLFAASCVVISHSVLHLKTQFLWFNFDNRLWFFDGVPLFFILSGMLVYRSCEKCIETNKPLWAFFLNRFLRIAPAIYVYLIVQTIILSGFKIINLQSIFSVEFVGWVMSNFLLIPVYSPSLFADYGVGVINGSLWTIPAEVSFYIITPLIYYFIKKKGFNQAIKILFFLSIIFLLVQLVFVLTPVQPMYEKFYKVLFMPHLLFFVIGIFLSKKWSNFKNSKCLFFISVLGYFLLRSNILGIEKYISPISRVFWGLPLGYAVLWFGYNAPLFFKRITRTVGDLSYGIYVWHMVVVNIFVKINLPNKLAYLPSTLLPLMVYCSSVAFAYLSWHVIEKQFLKLKPFTSNTDSI